MLVLHERNRMGQMDGWTDSPIHSLLVGWRNLFPVVLYVVSVFGSGGKKVLVQIHMYYLEYKTVVVVC
jgi:hypothetical protein